MGKYGCLFYIGTDFNHITKYMDNINSHINVNFHYLSNVTNPIFVAITIVLFKS